MKCTVIIDPDCEEKIVIYTKKRTALTEKIEKLAEAKNTEIFGYTDGEGVRLNPDDISLFTIIDGKLYAIDDANKKYLMRERLYSLEEILPEEFTKINQSTVANIKKIARFGTSFDGSMYVTFKNGYRDYVSRRQISNVKRALKVKK